MIINVIQKIKYSSNKDIKKKTELPQIKTKKDSKVKKNTY